MNLWEAAEHVGQQRNVDPKIIYAQWFHESGRGQETSGSYNFAGVKEWEDTGNEYHNFRGMEDWADYMSNYYAKYGVDGAQTPEDFVHRLKSGNYFQDDEGAYASSVRSIYDEEDLGGENIGGNSYVDDLSSSALDFSAITPNTEDQSITNTNNLTPDAIHGTNLLAHWVKATYGTNLSLTGGAEVGYHSLSATGHGHEDGWKIDVGNMDVDPTAFKAFCNQNGWSANFEKDHWDIDFSGSDSRDPQKGFSGDPLGGLSYAANLFGSSMFTGQDNTPLWNVHEHDFDDKPSFWSTLVSNFADSATTTGVADALQMRWGGLAHTSNFVGKMDDVTQEDIDYVRNALPGDEDAQKFALLNGRDSEEIRWLVNQKLVDKRRQAEVAQWRDANTNKLASLAMYAAGGAGYLADPLNFVPYANALKCVSIAGNMGKAVYNVSKATRIAQRAVRYGLEAAAYTTTDNLLKENFGGEKPEYGWSAAMAFGAGAVLGAVGGVMENLGKGNFAEKVSMAADEMETKAIEYAADLDAAAIKSETITEASKLHDPEFGKTINSSYYNKLEKNGRIVATTYEQARELVSRMAGIELPKTAKAFYVPNEDYVMLLTDRVKPEEIKGVLAHEFAVHSALRDSLGDKSYTKLMQDITEQSKNEGSVFNKARELAGSYDPEEILASAVEHDLLPKGIVSSIKGALNKTLKNNKIDSKVTQEQIMDVLRQQINNKREAQAGIHFNPDGSTVFAGIRFSKDNFCNPQTFAQFYKLEKMVTEDTQKDLPVWFPKKLGKMLEQGGAGVSINSTSNTIRGIAARLFDDPRGRGLGDLHTISAETHKEWVERRLAVPLQALYSARQEYCLNHKSLGRAAQMKYNQMVMTAYNARPEVGNVACAPKEFPPEVLKGVEALKELNDKRMYIMKNSATEVGSHSKNVADPEWVAVDLECHREVDPDKRLKFLSSFVDNADTGETALEQARRILTEYAQMARKDEVIKAKILRDIIEENKAIKAKNRSIPAGSNIKPKALLSTDITQEQIDKWATEHIENFVEQVIQGSDDIISREGLGSIGDLPFLRTRIPMDTTKVMRLPDGTEFSFDNNLRSFDLDSMAEKANRRIAGECAIKNVFNTQSDLENFLAQARSELQAAAKNQHINPHDRDYDIRVIENEINELRGMRPDIDAMGRLGALCHVMKNLTYALRGTNMTWAQMGEVAGTIGYGGASQLFHLVRPLGKLVEDIKYGRMSAEDLRDTAQFMFGNNKSSKLFTPQWGSRVVRDALTKKNIIDNMLIAADDATANLGKATSAINGLNKMTDWMERGMQECTIHDAVSWANGRTFSKWRDPFSPAKLKAAYISAKDAEIIKADILKYQRADKHSIDAREWSRKDPITYAKFYNLIQHQVDRAIVNGTRIGNRNIVKESHPLISLALQFKDYTLRAVNSQTMRAMTARDLDDAITTGLSIVTNTATYAARAAMLYGSYKAIGADKMAEEKWQQMMSDENLIRCAVFRSTILGSPLSFANDLIETGTGAQTIRTTVNRTSNRPVNDLGDFAGNIVSQTPSLDTASGVYDIGKYFYDVSQDKQNKRDFKKFLDVVPFSNWIPFAAFINNYVDKSGLPDKAPK